MGDVDFPLLAVPNRYQDVVQRQAVLYPLRGITATGQDVRDRTTALINQWRARVGALTNNGWDPCLGARSQHSIIYTRNCRPTFAITTRTTRVCTKTSICPFCYARWVRGIWLLIDADFPAPDDDADMSSQPILLDQPLDEPINRQQRTFRFHLVKRIHRFTRPILPPATSGITPQQNLALLLKDIVEKRKLVVDMVDPVGAFCYTTIVPSVDCQSWEIVHRQIFKVIPATVMPPPHELAGTIDRWARPTRRILMDTVAAVCSYPAEMLTGDALLVAMLLNVRRDIRFISTGKYRSFRDMK